MSKTENKLKELYSWIPYKIKHNPYGIKIQIQTCRLKNECYLYKLVLTYREDFHLEGEFIDCDFGWEGSVFRRRIRSMYIEFVEHIIDNDDIKHTNKDDMIHKWATMDTEEIGMEICSKIDDCINCPRGGRYFPDYEECKTDFRKWLSEESSQGDEGGSND